MSNRMTTSQLRREFILRKLRNTKHGAHYINLEGAWIMNDDLRRLIKDGHLKLCRTPAGNRRHLTPQGRAIFGDKRGSYVILTDLSKLNKREWLNCPCCGAGAPNDRLLIHSKNCTIRDDHQDYIWYRSGWWHNEKWNQK